MSSPFSPVAFLPQRDPFLIAADLFDPPETTDRDIELAELCVARLSTFVRQAWPLVEPEPFTSGWHIDVICEHLEACTAGQIRKLIINVPPRTSKSSNVSVFWPAWEWLTDPEVRWLFASYAQTLSIRDSVKCRRVIQSMGARARVGQLDDDRTLLQRVGYQGLLRLLGEDWQLAGDQNLKTRFDNDRSGHRIATSVDGSATGEGGDRIVADDPHKVGEAESALIRDATTQWWDQTMSTRMNDPKTGVRVIVMQRVHEKDVTGHLLAKDLADTDDDVEPWTHLCLPMRYEPSHPFVWPDDPRTVEGELLWPDRMGKAEVDQLEKDLGSYASAGQLQQRPAPAEGGIIKTRWWKYFDRALLTDPRKVADFTKVFQSWDTSFKDKTTSDYCVGQVWGAVLAKRFLLRQVRGQWGLDEAITQMRQLTDWTSSRLPAFAIHSIYVENTANGPDIIAALKTEISGITEVTVNRDKVQRVHAIVPQLESGNVFVPGAPMVTPTGSAPDPALTPSWVQGLIGECATFPNGANDDQVDCLSQALDPARFFAPEPAAAAATPPRPVSKRDRFSKSEFG